MRQSWKVIKHGEVDSLELCSDQTQIKLQKSEALIRIKWLALNHLDLWVIKGVAGHEFPLPMTLGCDIVGEIQELGSLCAHDLESIQQKGLKVGSSVLIQPINYCGKCRSCLNGFEATCETFGLIGETKNGGAATSISVPIKNLLPLKNKKNEKSAVCLPIAYTTAYSMIHRKLKLKKNEIIFIQAGGSGVSVAAIQLAKNIGATVCSTVRGKEKTKKLEQLGVDFIIQSDTQNVKQECKNILKKLGRKGFDCAIDHIGVDTFKQSLRFLDWGGRIATCGATSGSEVELDLKPVFFKNLSIYGTTMGSVSDLPILLDELEQGRLTPVVDSEFKMSDIKNALKKLESRKVFGKIIIENDL